MEEENSKQQQSRDDQSKQQSSSSQQSFEQGGKEKGPNMIAVLSYLGILFLVPLLAVKDDEFVQFHAKQGMILFIAEVATMVIAWIPILGWITAPIAWIVWLVFSIIGIVNVVSGKKKEIPLIGKFAEKFDI